MEVDELVPLSALVTKPYGIGVNITSTPYPRVESQQDQAIRSNRPE
ncbi:MAG: hypothetical protein ABSB40_11075 [Nitrososphaeria archaeon]